MTAYVIVNIDVTDSEAYEGYKQAAGPTVGQYGGRYLARGGRAEVLEGSWVPKRVVVLEFPSAARAREWFNSAEYTPTRALRHAATARTDMILVEGV